ncbi:MAG: response regulator [Treponema sp.]|nr:response regulator [Treponema sp.]
MYNILLTDDEQIVIDSLSFIINKNFESEVKIFTALSGTQALEIATREEIDIIFMDINMPGLNGLETVSCITKLKPDIVIVILSAFDRFQYAQEAMNLGAFKYITKPVNRNIVIQTIRSAMDAIDNSRGNQNVNQELHKKMDLISPMIENDFIYACIYNNDKNGDITSYLEYFNMQNLPWCFMCMEIPNINSENQYKIYLQIRQTINENHHCLISTFMMNRLVIFYPLYSVNKTQDTVNQECNKIYNQLCYKVGKGIKVGVSLIETDYAKINQSYNEAIGALNRISSLGGIEYSGAKEIGEISQKRNLNEYKNQIVLKLRQGNANGLKNFLELYFSLLQKTETQLPKIKNKLFDLIVTANNATVEINKDFNSEEFESAFSILQSEDDISMLHDFLERMLMQNLAAILEVSKDKENPVIEKICLYINQNLAEDITLEQMADYAGVNSFYLSKLFKEEKGVTFINFLTDKRLEQAKKLLKETNLSIKEITSEIGYNDQNYLSRLFKNKFGLSPKEFRNI